MAKLNEEQAWQVVALIFTRPSGVCTALSRLHERGLISESLYDTLASRMCRKRPAGASPFNSYWWPQLPAEWDAPRVQFATKQAKRVARAARRRRRG